MTHTKEPDRITWYMEKWRFVETDEYCQIYDRDGDIIWSEEQQTADGILSPTHIAQMRRIVACVNACAGLPDPGVVPEMVEFCRKFVTWYRELVEDRRNYRYVTPAWIEGEASSLIEIDDLVESFLARIDGPEREGAEDGA